MQEQQKWHFPGSISSINLFSVNIHEHADGESIIFHKYIFKYLWHLIVHRVYYCIMVVDRVTV